MWNLIFFQILLGHYLGGHIHTVWCVDLLFNEHVLGDASNNIVGQLGFVDLDNSVSGSYGVQCEQNPPIHL